MKKNIKYHLLLLIAVFFIGCRNHINEYTVVKKIELNRIGEEKYKVTLDFFPVEQYLYTDTLFNVGDTLYFSKKYSFN